MNQKYLKKLLDSCFLAKRIVETLPELPHGMKPRHIHVLDTIHSIQETQTACRVSDVSTALNITMPSITKLIQELNTLNLVEKYADTNDKRATLLCLTEKGQMYVKYHVTDFQKEWSEALDGLSDEKALEVTEVIEKLWQTMPRKEEKKYDRRN